VIVCDGERHDMLKRHLAPAVGIEQLGTDPRQFQTFLDDGFGHTETRRDISHGYAVVDECFERVELIGGVHGLPLDVSARLISVESASAPMTVQGTPCSASILPSSAELIQREKTAAPRDDRVFSAFVFADDERLQQNHARQSRRRVPRCSYPARFGGHCLPMREVC